MLVGKHVLNNHFMSSQGAANCHSERLIDLRFTSVPAPIELNKVAIDVNTGQFSSRSLSDAVSQPNVNAMVVRAWHERAGMSLVFFVNRWVET